MAGDIGKICPKCDYRRTGEESAPDYECPSCGIVYAKVEAALARKAEQISATTGDDSIWRASPHATEPDDEEFVQPKVFSFGGRIGRLRYLAYITGLYLVMIPLMAVAFGIMSLGEGASVFAGALVFVSYLGLLFFFVVWTVRRINDINMSGWFTFIFVFVSFILWFIPGTKGANNFGAQPAPNTTGVKILSIGIFVLVPVLGILAAIAIPAYNDYITRAAMQQ